MIRYEVRFNYFVPADVPHENGYFSSERALKYDDRTEALQAAGKMRLLVGNIPTFSKDRYVSALRWYEDKLGRDFKGVLYQGTFEINETQID